MYAALTDVSFAQVPFVEDALRQSGSGNYKRYAGLFHDQGRDFLYVVGPLLDLHQQSTGLLLVGRDVSELAGEIKQRVLANISFYDQHGTAIHSTLGCDRYAACRRG